VLIIVQLHPREMYHNRQLKLVNHFHSANKQPRRSFRYNQNLQIEITLAKFVDFPTPFTPQNVIEYGRRAC
jgi:hypothetical protein